MQNRCYASAGWDRAVRTHCTRHGIRYQGFSLLTANKDVLAHPSLAKVARRLGASPAQVVFRFALEVGMLPLSGTSSPEHGRQDLGAYDLPPLTSEERELLERVTERS